MTTPLATVANSIIEFILSLLRDPSALDELRKDPDAALARSKVEGLCADDIRAVAPIIYDRPDVVPRAASSTTPPPPSDNDVVNEITRITTNWTMIDNRATIVDQSVNQSIWTAGGDVTQVFDQSSAIASGDGSTAAGDDISTDGTPPDDDAVVPPIPPLDEAIEDALVDALPDPAETVEDDTAAPADPAAVLDDQLGAAQDAGVPAEAVDAVAQTVQPTEAPAPEPVYTAPEPEVDEAVWSEPADTVAVEEIAYADDLSEEQ